MRQLFGTAAIVFLMSSTADAAAIRSGFDAFSLPAADEATAGPVSIGFDLNFFGQVYGKLFVNMNGNVSFGSGNTAYLPSAMADATLPVIAPFFADVDTRDGGTVSYGTGEVDGKLAFGVNWLGVGSYMRNMDRLNSFQLVLIQRTVEGDFDIEFNYDKIEWDKGDVPDTISAVVGYSAGTQIAGTYFQLPGSGITGSFVDNGTVSLSTTTNGRQTYEVRDHPSDPSPIPLPATAPVLIAGFAALVAVRRRQKAA